MAEFWTICLLSIAMFVGCAVAGWIPLACNLSQRKIQLFTIFGSGLLVGTALAVIIPEGVDAMYSQAHSHQSSGQVTSHDDASVEQLDNTAAKAVGQRVLNEFQGLNLSQLLIIHAFNHLANNTEVPEHHDHIEGPHQAVGLALLVGFVFMLLVDQIGGHSHSHSPDIRLDDLNQSKIGTARSQQTDPKSKCHTATIGLVVHASADGIALGAAASTDRSDLQLIVFLAIMLHKAPAAFGLVSFLVHEGLELRKVKKHLLIFSLAAPVLAIVTFIFLNQSGKQMMMEVNATGIAMLFSAGTFLYVATVHVLPEITHSNSGNRGLTIFEVFVLVSGCLLPLILNIGHSHS